LGRIWGADYGCPDQIGIDGLPVSKRILYLGSEAGTSLHRAHALRRLGHEVEVLDPWSFLPKSDLSHRIICKLVYEGAAAALDGYIRRLLFLSIQGRFYDVAWVDQGELLGPKTIERLKDVAAKVVNYNVDDPFPADDPVKKRFTLYRKATPAYDLMVVVRAENIDEAYAAGARMVLHVHRSADEVAHAPLPLTTEDRSRWESDVSFIGTWMPERGPFIAHLLESGVPLTIFGGRWDKAKEWSIIRTAWKGPPIYGSDYVKAIQCSKVCLGLLSKSNRDLHTTRSVEIPFIGSVFCAQRTKEHEAMYEDGKEAVFWDTADECVEKVSYLLKYPEIRIRIGSAGNKRCIYNGLLNEIVLNNIINSLFN